MSSSRSAGAGCTLRGRFSDDGINCSIDNMDLCVDRINVSVGTQSRRQILTGIGGIDIYIGWDRGAIQCDSCDLGG